MAEGFRFIPLGLVRLRTFRLMGYLGATLTQVFTRAGGPDVSLRDVIIAQMGNGARECGWRHAPEARGGFGGFWKSHLESWVLPRKNTVDFRLLTEALRRVHTWWGRWKSQNRKNVYLSPYVEEPLNSKVIKSFVPELRNFSCFEMLMFYVYMLWTLYVRFTYPYLAMVQKQPSGRPRLRLPTLLFVQESKLSSQQL